MWYRIQEYIAQDNLKQCSVNFNPVLTYFQKFRSRLFCFAIFKNYENVVENEQYIRYKGMIWEMDLRAQKPSRTYSMINKSYFFQNIFKVLSGTSQAETKMNIFSNISSQHSKQLPLSWPSWPMKTWMLGFECWKNPNTITATRAAAAAAFYCHYILHILLFVLLYVLMIAALAVASILELHLWKKFMKNYNFMHKQTGFCSDVEQQFLEHI